MQAICLILRWVYGILRIVESEGFQSHRESIYNQQPVRPGVIDFTPFLLLYLHKDSVKTSIFVRIYESFIQ